MSRSPEVLLAAMLLLGGADPDPSPSTAADPASIAVAPIVELNASIVGLNASTLDLELPLARLDESLIDTDRRITLAADVLFAFDKADLSAKARSRVEQAAEILKERAPGKRIRIDGYTDAKGSDAYNAELSRKRAEAVRVALDPLLEGSGMTLAAAGHGAAKPVAPNEVTVEGRVVDNPKGRARNRRVEIIIPR
ncbi:OmpA family protein [Streptosporangium sp. NPDC048047]|uniref:OmpA family protein n=1 Tax=Streptosporangium sp. NPDC048047 TaxID=3155748 RepID=UPI00342A3B5E